MKKLSSVGAIVVLLTVIIPSAKHAAGQGATATPTAKVTVYPLAYVSGGEGSVPFGICHAVPISVGGDVPGDVRVGVIETRIGGASLMWRTAAWQATLTAAQLLDFHPQAMQTTFTVEGGIDGPSAGALLTIGVISAVLGDKLRDDVTMTGTINPDGMIGPVGGIPFKIEGAARVGKKIVLIPVHDRFEFDPRTKKPVDLVAHGERLGVKVIPTNDIWSAYREFTGKSLPRPESGNLPTVSTRMSQHVLNRIPNWIKLYDSAREKFMSWPENARPEYAKKYMLQADTHQKKINRLLEEGQFAPAYWDGVWSMALSWIAHEVGRYQYNYNLKGREAAFGLVFKDEWLKREVDRTSAAMRFYRPQTFDQLSIYMQACGAFFTGLCYQHLADVVRSNLPEDPDVAVNWVVAVAEQHALCWVNMKLARDYLELADRYEGTPIPEGAPVDKMARFFLQGADAGLSMVNELEVKKVAKQYNLSNNVAVAELSLRDPQYAMANLGIKQIVPSLPKYFGDGKQLEYARLAAGVAMHTRTAMLVAKYYSLGVELDENYQLVGLKNERALEDWLDDSKEQARRAVVELDRAKIDPTTCLQIYSVARIYEGRELSNRIEALEYYFTTNVTAQVLKRLAAGSRSPANLLGAPAGDLPAPPPSDE